MHTYITCLGVCVHTYIHVQWRNKGGKKEQRETSPLRGAEKLNGFKGCVMIGAMSNTSTSCLLAWGEETVAGRGWYSRRKEWLGDRSEAGSVCFCLNWVRYILWWASGRETGLWWARRGKKQRQFKTPGYRRGPKKRRRKRKKNSWKNKRLYKRRNVITGHYSALQWTTLHGHYNIKAVFK